MIKKIIIASLCLLFSFGAIAQTSEKQELRPTKDYKVGSFSDNWFFSVGVGVQTYLSENYTAGSIVDHFSPAVDISVGKWFTPVMGVRAQLSGLNARGYNLGTTPYIDLNDMEDGLYRMNFNYINFHADFLFNLHSQFFRYNKERAYELIPFVGMGWLAVLNDGIADQEFAANAGLINRFRINDKLDFDIELKAIVMRSAVDGNSAKRINIPASATIGLTYAFGSDTEFRSNEISQTPIIEKNQVVAVDNQEEIDHLKKSLAEQQRLADNANKTLVQEKLLTGQLQKEVDEFKKQKEDQISCKVGLKVFFKIGTTRLDELNESNLEYFANNIKNLNKKYVIYGYADSNTGKKTVNEKLAIHRAEYVYKQLTEKYGISKDLLSIKSDVVSTDGNPKLVRMAEVK